MNRRGTGETFGCERCLPDSADAAWETGRTLVREITLIDESHVAVMILSCDNCAQRFVSVFTETIDWAEGQGPQYSIRLPITDTEALSSCSAETR